MRHLCKVILSLAVAAGSYAQAFARDASRYPRNVVPYSGVYAGNYRQLFQDLFPMSISLYHDDNFDSSERQIITEAMQLFMERALDDGVVECAFRNSSKDRPPSVEVFKGAMFAALSLRAHDSTMFPGFAYITSFSADDQAVGIGYINLFYDRDRPLPGYDNRNYLYIALNRDLLGQGSTYWLASNAEYWAGVIGHEFLHNLGYVHPTGYPGSFIKEYGDCIWSHGLGAAVPEGVVGDRTVVQD